MEKQEELRRATFITKQMTMATKEPRRMRMEVTSTRMQQKNNLYQPMRSNLAQGQLQEQPGVRGDTEERLSSTTQQHLTRSEETASTATRKRALSSQISKVGSKRRVKSSLDDDEDFSFKDMFKMTMMQRQQESEDRHREEHRRREYEDMRRRDDERIRRDEERLRRDEMQQNQQMFQQMFAIAFAMQQPHTQNMRSHFATQHPSNSSVPGNQNRTQGATADLDDDDVSNCDDAKDCETNADAH